MSDHNPIYHLKDAYFFEVPKALWRQNWQTLDQVPQFLRAGRPDITDVAEFNQAMDGKILIPQPFGALDSLFEKKSGFCISKYMILELLLAGILLLLFTRLAKRLRSGDPAKGAFANLFEAMILFVRDQIARPAIDSHDHGHGDHGGGDHGGGDHGGGDHGHGSPSLAGVGGPTVAVHREVHEGDRFVPLLLTLFFFVHRWFGIWSYSNICSCQALFSFGNGLIGSSNRCRIITIKELIGLSQGFVHCGFFTIVTQADFR